MGGTISFAILKTVSLLVYPLTQVFLLLLLGLVALWRSHRRLAGPLLLVAFAWFYITATGLLGGKLIAWLEHDYPPVAVEALPASDVILLLGGAVHSRAEGAPLGNLNRWADRLVFTAALYHAGKAPLILISGGGAEGGSSEAALMRDILLALAVPLDALVLEERSRTTFDNARYTAPIIRQRGWDRVLLVTSAFHMRRAMAVYRQQGLSLTPAPTDHQFLDMPVRLIEWLPTIQGMALTTYAFHELAGFAVYQLQGKL